MNPAEISMDWVFRALEGAPLPHKNHCPCPIENCDDEEFWEREWTALGKHLDSPEA